MRIKTPSLLIILATALASLCFAACDDEVSQIGNSLAQGTMTIYQDTLRLEVPSHSVSAAVIDSRSETHLLGRLSSPDYGNLDCSFVSQLLSSSSLSIPDSIGIERLDSVRMVVTMPRGKFVGDSVAPQQLAVYRLSKQLPSSIESNFDPKDYYSSSTILGSATYTLSEILASDTTFKRTVPIRVRIPLPLSVGRDVYNAYKNTPEIFAWPQSFNKYFPGIYMRRTFGSGCIANIQKAEMMLYFHYLVDRTTVEDGKSVTRQVHIRDSVAVFATAPEVLSSTNISLSVSDKLAGMIADGQTLIVSPAGYNARFTFPAKTIVDNYAHQGSKLAVVSALTFTIPAHEIANDLGIAPPPQLLMVKASEADSFFRDGKKPDNKTSFYASYNSANGYYIFDNLREYILPMLQSGEVDADTDFVLIPAVISTESYYDSALGKDVAMVTRCAPYLEKPSMVRLDTNNGFITFTYSVQELK